MGLRWDSLLVRELARELEERFAGARLRGIRLDGRSRTAALLFRDATLLWRLHPTDGAPTLHPPAEPDRSDLALPSKVRRVHAPPDERLLVCELIPNRGRHLRKLFVELLGNQWNLVVTEGAEERIRHVLVRRDGPRGLRSGATYEPPAPSPREGATGLLTAGRWREILSGTPPKQLRRTVVSTIAWTSPLNASALMRPDLDAERALREGRALWQRMASGDLPPSPTLLELERGIQPYPWPLPGIPGRPVDSLLDAFAVWSLERSGSLPGTGALPGSLLASLERAVDLGRRRVTSLVAELAGVEDPETLHAVGDLLLARLRDVPSGTGEVVLEGFDGTPVSIALDPSRAPHENAHGYYDRAARARRARTRIPEMILEAEQAVQELAALLDRARAGEAAAGEIRDALPPDSSAPGRGTAEASLPYRVYRSSGGLEIRVGRGARHNDELTFRYSAPDDIWLHARHAAGAHVILRWLKPGNPPARDLEEAALLAAVHSRARTSASVPVDWTRRKHVRKPRGAAPGAVVPQRVSTLFVEPDAARAEGLKEG
ncbi:MAG: NFACT RNA binding domain-containing protein [Gemmatimonadota bacterium]